MTGRLFHILTVLYLTTLGVFAFGQNQKPGLKSRSVDGSKAYFSKGMEGPHLNVKVTPPGKNGKADQILVEAYNYSKSHLVSARFWLIMSNAWGTQMEVEVDLSDIRPNYSAAQWIKVTSKDKMEDLSKVKVRNLRAFDEKAQKVSLPVVADLINR